jgi:hypothetical protein
MYRAPITTVGAAPAYSTMVGAPMTMGTMAASPVTTVTAAPMYTAPATAARVMAPSVGYGAAVTEVDKVNAFGQVVERDFYTTAPAVMATPGTRMVSMQELSREGRFRVATPEEIAALSSQVYAQPQYNQGGPPTTLVVKVKHARGLKNTDGFFGGKSDPYVVCHLVGPDGKDATGSSQTSVKQDTLDPVWDEELVFEGIDNPYDYTVRMNVFDQDTFLGTGHLDWLSSDDQMGDGKIALEQVRMKESWQDFNLPVDANLKSKHQGVLNVALLLTQRPYQAQRPAPNPYSEPPQDAVNLVVKVKSAEGVKETDSTFFAGKSDPYVVLHLVDANNKDVKKFKPKQTSVCDNTLNPVWDEDIVFKGLTNPYDYSLRLNMFDKDTFLGTGHLDWLSRDDPLGDGVVSLQKIQQADTWYDAPLPVDAKMKGKHQTTLNIAVMLTPQDYEPTKKSQHQVIQSDGKPSSAPKPGAKSLVVKVKQASGLPNLDSSMFGGGKSDPYVVLHLVDKDNKDVKSQKVQQTSVKNDTLDPVWNEDIVFDDIGNPFALTLRMSVFDKDTFLGSGHLDWLSKDDQEGEDAKVPLSQIGGTGNGFRDMTFDISPNMKTKGGKAKLFVGLSARGW